MITSSVSAQCALNSDCQLQRHCQKSGYEKEAKRTIRQFVEINSLPNDALVQILLYGDRNLSNEINKSILEVTLVFIHNTG